MSIQDSIENNLPVLVLDDEAEITKSIARDLRRHAQVHAFTNAEEALAAFETRPFSVVISDLKMPGTNGIDFLSRCYQLRPEAQRILLTAYVDLASLPDSVNKAHLNTLMTKPWEPEELQRTIEYAQRINELERENSELRRIALLDALTGVANHRYFWERLESEFSRAKRYGRPLALIMCDIDNFKVYNDTHGHQKGDAILRDVAQSLESNRRAMDTVARYGGEEFAIVLPEASRPQAIEIGIRLLETTLSRTGISLSFGVADYPNDGKSPTELVYGADRALLKAKAQGKGQVLGAHEV